MTAPEEDTVTEYLVTEDQVIRVATPEDIAACGAAARKDGGSGIILVDAAGSIIAAQDESQPWIMQPVERAWIE